MNIVKEYENILENLDQVLWQKSLCWTVHTWYKIFHNIFCNKKMNIAKIVREKYFRLFWANVWEKEWIAMEEQGNSLNASFHQHQHTIFIQVYLWKSDIHVPFFLRMRTNSDGNHHPAGVPHSLSRANLLDNGNKNDDNDDDS